jgi:hypothetical protein
MDVFSRTRLTRVTQLHRIAVTFVGTGFEGYTTSMTKHDKSPIMKPLLSKIILDLDPLTPPAEKGEL